MLSLFKDDQRHHEFDAQKTNLLLSDARYKFNDEYALAD